MPKYLAEQAISGDEASFTALCGTLKQKLFRTAKGILGDENLALDAVSEAVFRAFKGIKRLRQPQYAETWFIRILINAANDLRRKQKHEIVMETVPESAYYDNHSELEFTQMIGSLQPELREIISLKYYSGYTLNEISAILEIPEGTVKSRLNRALNLLRLEVSDE
ncbi:MAG: RNA polymerase sigma factor [Treponema sp.]|jgi:RNA polymerase sigma-70 factor (ECF subfamily)|nr:RNA polymerase sigma factor [Treponema sp.]